MSLRVGSLLAITGLALALLFGSLFVAFGGMLIVFGGIVLALGMESVLAEQDREVDLASEAGGTEHQDVAP